jgi:transmembrane sensor
MQRTRLQELFEKFLGEKMSPQEIRQLQELIQDNRNTEVLDTLLKAAYTNKSLSEKGDYDLDEIFEELKPRVRYEQETPRPVIPVNSLKRMGWWMVAASLILVSGIGTYFLFPKKMPGRIAVKTQKQDNIILPGSNKAVLTLANGSTILLDDAEKGMLAEQGNTKIIKSANGNLIYNTGSAAAEDIVYNTLATPRGGQYEVVLPDGTRAWLNAQTSLKFPTVFSGKTREVELSGEAYFEVAKRKDAPFVVLVKHTRVTVLGTHFNVNGYGDEKNMLTTLLEGSVKFSNGPTDQLLQPGQQAVYNTTTNSLAVKKVDVNQVIGWKNGVFEFDNMDLSAMLRQISRWYDVDIQYEPRGEEIKFGGAISRKLNLSDILRLLETNEVHFKVEGRKIIVNP